jgi:hypothetical protein
MAAAANRQPHTPKVAAQPLTERIKNHVAFWNGVRVEGHPEPRTDGGRGGWWRKLVGRAG